MNQSSNCMESAIALLNANQQFAIGAFLCVAAMYMAEHFGAKIGKAIFFLLN